MTLKYQISASEAKIQTSTPQKIPTFFKENQATKTTRIGEGKGDGRAGSHAEGSGDLIVGGPNGGLEIEAREGGWAAFLDGLGGGVGVPVGEEGGGGRRVALAGAAGEPRLRRPLHRPGNVERNGIREGGEERREIADCVRTRVGLLMYYTLLSFRH